MFPFLHVIQQLVHSFGRGVVKVDIRLDELDINQCPMDFHVPNAFKGTARCHYEDSVVSRKCTVNLKLLPQIHYCYRSDLVILYN